MANYLIVAVKKAFILAWPRICVDGFDPLCDENTTNRKMGRALNELLASGEISTDNPAKKENLAGIAVEKRR